MFNFDYSTNIKEHNPNWPEILDYPYRTLTVGGYGKSNALLNL